ncbi:MAG: bifunctional DNA primase/polymerase [Acetobacteraceae bacterium]
MRTDIVTLACNLARNSGWHVFPCTHNKTPATPKGADGSGGFKYASTDPARIEELWRRWPGPLIGIATGEVSGVDVLDADTNERTGLQWWTEHADRVPPTRTYRTKRGGVHCYFQHRAGLRCSQSKVGPHIDVRADGGYAVFWYAAGLECLDHSRPAPWPDWLAELAAPPPPPQAPDDPRTAPGDLSSMRALGFILTRLDAVREAPEGSRHATLLRSARAIGGLSAQAGIGRSALRQMLFDALKYNRSRDTIRDWNAARRTIDCGLDDGIANPLRLNERPYARDVA